MTPVPLTVRCLVASGTTLALVACSSGGSSSDSGAAPTPSSSATSASPTVDPVQDYLDQVNALCDALLPQVVEATEGGSTDVPAADWVRTWPAHEALLDQFDADVAEVAVPPDALAASQVLGAYQVWATGIDDARIAAASQGEEAWQAELAAEADIADAPELLALAPAGFHDSCQAR